MGKKKNKSQGQKNNDDQPQQQLEPKRSDNGGDGGEKVGGGEQALVLKVDFHCEGCAAKTKKAVRSLEGVESVKRGPGNKLMVTGNVDPAKLREIVEQKAQGKVDFLTPLPKKDKESGKKEKDGGGEKGEKKAGDKPDDKKSKNKEPPVTTAVMKVDLHCDGCVQKIRKTVTKTKGYQEMSIDAQKNLLTVKGSIDMKALAETLKYKLKKPVEIVPPKKEGGEKKEKGGGGGGGGGGGKVEAVADEDSGAGVGMPPEESRMQFVQYGYPDPYTHGYMMGYPMGQYQFYAPQMFSDENPNACSIM